MLSPARKLSYKLLFQIESRRIFSDDALNSDAMDQLDIRDRHLTTEIVYGTLRWQGLLDHVLTHASSRPWQEVEPGARILLRMSLYQMWRMDRIPDHALVNDAVELAKREFGKGIDLYVNGILRSMARTRPWARESFRQKVPPWVARSMPKWLWARWSARYGEKTAAEFADSLNTPPQAAFRLDESNRAKLPEGAILSDLVPDSAIRVSGTGEPIRAYRYQDEASQLIPHLLAPVSGLRIWDACAAPGGKTAILGRLCGESGQVIASDLRKDRVVRMAHLLREAHELNVNVVVADASKPAPFRRQFDAVLVDAPCSGLGTLRRNPEIKWRFEEGYLRSLQQVQTEIVDAVAESVRVGGRLLYSTCSTEPEENEEVIQSFLSRHPDFRLERPLSPPGIEQWVGKDDMIRTYPSSRLWDGFFAALLVRNNR